MVLPMFGLWESAYHRSHMIRNVRSYIENIWLGLYEGAEKVPGDMSLVRLIIAFEIG